MKLNHDKAPACSLKGGPKVLFSNLHRIFFVGLFLLLGRRVNLATW